MRPVICDICGMQEDVYIDSEWSGLNLILDSDFRNICGACTEWLVETLKTRKNILIESKHLA